MNKAILLFMMMSAGHLYGVSLDEKISEIRQLPVFMQADLREFTVIVAGISMVFPDATREEIAIKFDTRMARKYLALNYSLMRALLTQDADRRLQYVQGLLNDGADPNFTYKDGESYRSVLAVAYEMAVNYQVEGIRVVGLLLENGATPNVKQLDSTLPEFARKITEKRCNEYKLLDLLQQYGAKLN